MQSQFFGVLMNPTCVQGVAAYAAILVSKRKSLIMAHIFEMDDISS